MNKAKIALGILLVAGIFLSALKFSQEKTIAEEEPARQNLTVTVQSFKDSLSFKKTASYPGTVVGDQEITITAKSSGTAKVANYEIGDRVAPGSLLAKIDDVGNSSPYGPSGFQSAEVRQSQLSVDQAKKNLDIAKKVYKKLKDDYEDQEDDSTLAKTVTEAQLASAKGQIGLAEIQYESALSGFSGTLDDHLITSPIAGFITGKSVSQGDSVSNGQTLYTISQTGKVKVRFFVDQSQLEHLAEGTRVFLVGNRDNEIPAIVGNISPQADSATKRFLIEAYPESQESGLVAGTIVDVSFPIARTVRASGNIILPLSAITVGQNGSHIFLVAEGRAKKISVEIRDVDGETAEIKTDIPEDSQIIIGGSKLVQDGDPINISQ